MVEYSRCAAAFRILPPTQRAQKDSVDCRAEEQIGSSRVDR